MCPCKKHRKRRRSHFGDGGSNPHLLGFGSSDPMMLAGDFGGGLGLLDTWPNWLKLVTVLIAGSAVVNIFRGGSRAAPATAPALIPVPQTTQQVPPTAVAPQLAQNRPGL